MSPTVPPSLKAHSSVYLAHQQNSALSTLRAVAQLLLRPEGLTPEDLKKLGCSVLNSLHQLANTPGDQPNLKNSHH